jgi:hypothetical protein
LPSVSRLHDALKGGEFAVGGLTLGKNPSLNVIASFAKDEKAQKFLAELRGGDGVASLAGLPKVEPLVLYAATGDGERNADMTRALLKNVLDKWLGVEVFISQQDRTRFLDAFSVMYRRLKGSRAVVYQVSKDNAARVGKLAAVLVMDIDDPSKHLAEWKNLVEVANNSAPRIVKQGRESAPKFTFTPEAEKLGRLRVDVLKVTVPNLPAEVEKGYRELLGPNWNIVRLVVQGKQVVALFGSDLETLRLTLTHLKTGAKGIAEDVRVQKTLARVSPERKIEFHFNLRDYLTITDGRKFKDVPRETLSSLVLTLETDRVQVELKADEADVRPIVEWLDLHRTTEEKWKEKEDRAAALWQKARDLVAKGKENEAIAALHEIVASYNGTRVIGDAFQLLNKLEGQANAASRLEEAKKMLKDPRDAVRQKLQQLIRDYPDTPAAKEARELLKKLDEK